MVVVAAFYASIEMNKIDSGYSDLIAKNVKALQNLTIARVLSNRFAQLVYQEIAEPDPDRMRVVDAELDRTAAEFHSSVALINAEAPGMTQQIDAAAALFDQAVSDSGPIRAAALSDNNDKAIKLSRETFDPEFRKGRQSLTDLADEVHARCRSTVRPTHCKNAPHNSDHLDRDHSRPCCIFHHCFIHRAD